MYASEATSTGSKISFKPVVSWLRALGNQGIGLSILFFTGAVLKLLTVLLFSSGYKDELFVPFVTNFVTTGANPWDTALSIGQLDAFPYPPLMLYILSITLAPIAWLGSQSLVLENFLYKLPTIAADLAIAWLLLRQFPNEKKRVLLFYFLSPIIWFASYAHGQLDLIPTALLFGAVDALARNRPRIGAVLVGLALCTKFHTAAALPFLVVFSWKRFGWREGLCMALLPLIMYGAISLPYLTTLGYQELVLNNSKQLQVFNTLYTIGNYEIFLPIFMVGILYARFIVFGKINQDLLVTFLGILFAIFLLLINPSPAWYVWLVPFLAVFSIKTADRFPATGWLVGTFNLCYLLFFVLFYQGDHLKLTFLGSPLFSHSVSPRDANFSFTLLEASLAACVYAMYRFGVRSNAFYQRQGAILIGVAGDSGSGKTVLANDLKGLFQNEMDVIEGDGDHRWERHDKEWQATTPLSAKANFLHDQANDLIDLHLGKAVYRREYDHKTGRFTARQRYAPKNFMLLSGLHSFYLPKMRKIIDLKIYLEPADDLRRYWKYRRDMEERGYLPEQVEAALQKRQDDALKYVLPQKQFADLVVQYLCPHPLSHEDTAAIVPLQLKVSLDANISLERFLHFLRVNGHTVDWDYENDLAKQHLVFRQSLPSDLLRMAAQELLPNMADFVPQDAQWADGYRGIVQMLVLLMVHGKMRES